MNLLFPVSQRKPPPPPIETLPASMGPVVILIDYPPGLSHGGYRDEQGKAPRFSQQRAAAVRWSSTCAASERPITTFAIPAHSVSRAPQLDLRVKSELRRSHVGMSAGGRTRSCSLSFVRSFQLTLKCLQASGGVTTARHRTRFWCC
jgi:hypothetical protein